MRFFNERSTALIDCYVKGSLPRTAGYYLWCFFMGIAFPLILISANKSDATGKSDLGEDRRASGDIRRWEDGREQHVIAAVDSLYQQ